MTAGEIMFQGGIAGLALSGLTLAIVLWYLRNRRRKIQENLEKNY